MTPRSVAVTGKPEPILWKIYYLLISSFEILKFVIYDCKYERLTFQKDYILKEYN